MRGRPYLVCTLALWALASPACAAAGLGASPAAPPSAPRAQPASMPSPRVLPAPWACRIDAQRLQEADTPVLLAERTTVYPKDWPSRNQNLLTASRYLCGRLLRPGQILSFNAVIGPTTRERGYDVGPTFVGDRVVPGWGGGVCQVASTLYGVARWAAVEVVERHPHGLRVPYVPPGEDATVSSPYLDLVVRNSTPGNLLVAAGAQGPKVTVALFGTVAVGRGSFRHRILSETPFREIRLADPTLPQGKEVEVQEGVPGAVAHTWYTVHYPDGTQRTFDLGVDHYRPTARVVRYGTKPTS